MVGESVTVGDVVVLGVKLVDVFGLLDGAVGDTEMVKLGEIDGGGVRVPVGVGVGGGVTLVVTDWFCENVTLKDSVMECACNE